MKKRLLVCAMLLCAVVTFGQTNFQVISLSEACKQAKAEGKLVFVDLYTSWCGPCKLMATKVFPDPQLGEFMNQHFVCVKYNTEEDDDGKMLMEMFNVQAYPTFLLLNSNRELENQIVAATLDPLEFMKKVDGAIKASIASLKKQYADGDRQPAFLTNYLQQLLQAQMMPEAQEVRSELFKALPDAEKSKREYWYIFDNQMLSPIGSEAMDFLFTHFKQFCESMGEEKVLERISMAFEIKLRDMIRGRERMDDLDKLVKQMKPHHFNSRSRMDVYVSLAQLLRDAHADQTNEKKIEKVLLLCEKEFPKLDGEDVVWFYFPVTMFLYGSGTPVQQERVMKLHEYTYKNTDHEPLRIGLGNMLKK
ncbi:MAG: thioredoxin family protein [Odoribacter sp.]|nr:thioredoxin family protein [Odoribacter sp.]